MHGGAKGSGAPAGNDNAFKHGLFTKEAIAVRKKLYAFIAESNATLKKLDWK